MSQTACHSRSGYESLGMSPALGKQRRLKSTLRTTCVMVFQYEDIVSVSLKMDLQCRLISSLYCAWGEGEAERVS